MFFFFPDFKKTTQEIKCNKRHKDSMEGCFEAKKKANLSVQIRETKYESNPWQKWWVNPLLERYFWVALDVPGS